MTLVEGGSSYLIVSFLRPFRVVGEAVDFMPMSLVTNFFFYHPL